jgi:hypothetical protein
VFQELTTTAEASQADLRTLLDERGITYTPFWIANTLLVEGDRSPSSGPRPSLIGDITLTRHVLDATTTSVNDLSCGGVPANNSVWGQGRLDAFHAAWLAVTR